MYTVYKPRNFCACFSLFARIRLVSAEKRMLSRQVLEDFNFAFPRRISASRLWNQSSQSVDQYPTKRPVVSQTLCLGHHDESDVPPSSTLIVILAYVIINYNY